MAMYVSTGTTNKTTGWVLSNEGVITLNTTNLAYAQFSGNGAYTAGNGITITGNSIAQSNVGTAGTYTKVTTDAMGNVTSGTGATTTDISEGSNLYYTDTRARSALSVSGLPLTYNATTGVFGMNQATSGTAGYLSAADWTTFNTKYGSVSSTGGLKAMGIALSLKDCGSNGQILVWSGSTNGWQCGNDANGVIG